MKTFKEFLQEKLAPPELTSDYFAIYGGRFQPFHPGHYAVVKYMEQKFGNSHYIATSNKVNPDSDAKDWSPFGFKDKEEIIKGFFPGIDTPIAYCANPTFTPHEIYSLPENKGKAMILLVCEKDINRYKQNKNMAPLPKDWKSGVTQLEPYEHSKKAYVDIVPIQADGVSGTAVREILCLDNEKESLTKMKEIYGPVKYDLFKKVRERIMAQKNGNL